MRKILCVLTLSLLASAASAQVATSTYFPPLPGSTMTGPLLLPDGTSSAPTLAASSNPSVGLYFASSGATLSFTSSTVPRWAFNGNGLYARVGGSQITLGNLGYFGWSAGVDGLVTGPDTYLYRDAANTLALRNAGTAGTPVPQTFNVYNFCDGVACATGYERGFSGWSSTANQFTIGTESAGTGAARPMRIKIGSDILSITTGGISPITTDAISLGTSTVLWQNAFVSRSIQGSKSKALTDNTATAFVRLTVADDDYEACAFGWTAYAEDTATDARQVTKNRTNVAILNNSGTEACNFSATADDVATLATAGTLTCTFDCNSASADTVDLRATCDTSLAATTTLTFEYRLDCESTTTVTPQ